MNWRVNVDKTKTGGSMLAVLRADIEDSSEVDTSEQDDKAKVIIDRDVDGVICGVGFISDEPISIILGKRG